MFHVKPHTMQLYFKRIFITIAFYFLFAFYLSSQSNEGRISLGTSLDLGAGKEFNNYATTWHLNYNLLEKFRISPSLSYFFNKDNMKMRTFALNCHYLFPELAGKLFPEFRNQGICFYSVAGILVSNFNNTREVCSDCSVDFLPVENKSNNMFGFDFGVGAEYKIPTLLPVWRDMSVNFEMKYQILDVYNRPLMSFGIIYDF